jgi:monovalent cation:H+ antiporter-2, CPA2 family
MEPGLSELEMVVDFVFAVAAAFVGGMIAQRLRQPVILGYLLAGMAIGPYTWGPVSDPHNVQVVAEMGVAFLMFAIGVEFSPSELLKMRWVAGIGGLLQIGATVLLGLAAAPLLGLDLLQGIFLGSVLALSSTMVALKLLMNRGEMESLHGRIVLGILIVQDLSLVPMVVILPALAEPMESLLATLLLAAAKAAAILAGGWLLGTRIVPAIFARVASTGSRELFLLAIITLSLGTALGTYALGLSLALGAFLAGLVISESEYSHQILADVLPLRDIFSSVFFVSVGMLIDPWLLIQNVQPVLLLVAVVVIGKGAISTGVALLFRYPAHASILVGMALAQIGEFSFVLTNLGEQRGILDPELTSIILGAALASILLNPLLIHVAPTLQAMLSRVPLAGHLFWERFEAPASTEGREGGHTVICGYGRVGHEMARALRARGESFVVVELDPHVVDELRRAGIPYIYGDASRPAVLEHAGVERASLVAAALPDTASVRMVVRAARRLNGKVRIIARVRNPADKESILAAGADEVVSPAFEAGLEFVRHAMHLYGVPDDETELMLRERRAEM